MNDSKPTFKEINESYTLKEAIAEAKRCLNCKRPSCKNGCPIENDIPEFIHELSKGNMGNAMAIINEKSNLPAICGRVCPHEKQCQGHCVLYPKGKGIEIGKLERFIADFDTEMNLIREKLPQKTRGKVAVIGSGPAGLTVAGDLARQGFNVTIFESQAEAGGVLMYGIPEYRLPKQVVRQEIQKIEALGVNFVLNCVVGKQLTIDDMFAQGYDAIFIGSGTALPKSLDVPGAGLRGVIQATYLLHMANIYNEGTVGRDKVPVIEGERVAVVGWGNVGIGGGRAYGSRQRNHCVPSHGGRHAGHSGGISGGSAGRGEVLVADLYYGIPGRCGRKGRRLAGQHAGRRQGICLRPHLSGHRFPSGQPDCLDYGGH